MLKQWSCYCSCCCCYTPLLLALSRAMNADDTYVEEEKNGCEIFGRGKQTNRTITKHLLEPASRCPHQHPLPLVGQLHSETMINVMVNEKKTHLHGHHPLQHRLAERGGFCFYWLLALGVVIVYFCVCDVGRYSMVVACYAARHLFETIIFGALYLNFVR